MRSHNTLSNWSIALVLVFALLTAVVGFSLSKAEASPAMTDMKRPTITNDASSMINSCFKVSTFNVSHFGQDAITSNCSIDIRAFIDPVQGNITYVCNVDCMADPNETDECPEDGANCCEQSVNGSIYDAPNGIDWWPETWAVAQYFNDQVDVSEPFTEGSIDVAVNSTIGPLYVDGDLELYTSVDSASANLEGIIYITGDLYIGGAKDFTLNLSDQVIFVENADADIGGPINNGAAEVFIDSNCTLTGSGAFFAIGDIWFQPKLLTSPQDFMFIMSIEGWVITQPLGGFYGSIAGNDYVDVQPNNSIIHTDGDDFWNTFPATTLISIRIPAGWNMVSMPAMPTYNSTSAVFPGAAGVFTWNATSRSYYVPTTIEPDKGYWVAVTEDTTFFVGGTPVEIWTTDIKAGWNMIGSVITIASIADPNDTPDSNVISTAYWWDPVSRAYTTTTDIEPGKGYWAASIQDCTLTLP